MKLWEKFFEEVLTIFSTGAHQNDLLAAKGIFFKKLGRSHEIRADYYEAVSQSFLEWYIFDYLCRDCAKTPAVVFLVRKYGSEEQRRQLYQALFHHWSLYKVDSMAESGVMLQDLLFGRKRFLCSNEMDFRLWKVKKDQIIQARLFQAKHDSKDSEYFATHVWLHPETEYDLLEKLCGKLLPKWGLHREFLKDCLESLIRSLALRDQMVAMRSKNWIYQELWKRYA